jgi:hypothetical protein
MILRCFMLFVCRGRHLLGEGHRESTKPATVATSRHTEPCTHPLQRITNTPGSGSDQVKKRKAGHIKTLDDGSRKIMMPMLLEGDSESHEVEESALCFRLLLKLQTAIVFSLQTGGTKPSFKLRIPGSDASEVLLFVDLINITSTKAIPGSISVPFDPPHPASASGLVCLLLLLEQATSPLEIFGSSICGPRLAVQCLLVRPNSCSASASLRKCFSYFEQLNNTLFHTLSIRINQNSEETLNWFSMY